MTVLYATWRFAKSDSMIRISTTLKCRLKAATMPSEFLLGIAGDISASTCTELYSGKWVRYTTYSQGVGDNRIGKVGFDDLARIGNIIKPKWGKYHEDQF